MARVDVVMPKMGESVMEGTVLEWKKAVGETVEQDETLLEISTDKVDSEVPSPAAGRIVEILVEENDTVDVGTPIAVIETDVDAPVDGGGASGGGDAAPEAVAEAAEPLDVNEPAAMADTEPAAKPAAPIVRTQEAAQAEAHEASGGGASGGTAADAPAGGGVEVVMPKMGESVMEGTVLEWKKAVGDEVEQDETLLEISTDKVDSEVPSPAAGTLVQILVEEGETVDVGTPIAVIGSAVAGEVDSPAAPEPTHTTPAPAVSETSPEASGDAPAPAETSYGFSGQPGGPGLAAPAGDGAPASGEDGGPIPRRDDQGNFYSPLVRSIAETEGVSLSELQSIQGTGSEGRITKADVMGYLEGRGSAQPAAPEAPAPQPVQPAAPPAPTAQPVQQQTAPAPAPRPQAAQQAATAGASGDVEVIHMDRMRQLIAEHMTRSKSTSAHVTSFAEIDVTGLVQHREAHKVDFQKREGVKLTYTPYFLHAAIEPLRAHPLLNSSVEGTEIHVKKAFHIGIAVAIGKKGLLVPVVRNAGQQNLTGLAHTMADLAERARTKKLQPDELQGGTFTVTNVGSLGSLMGTPIINQPQVAILSPGAIVKRPVVVEDPTLGDVIAVRQMMYVSLSYDHRIIDGAMAASFLRAYRESLEAITPESQLF